MNWECRDLAGIRPSTPADAPVEARMWDVWEATPVADIQRQSLKPSMSQLSQVQQALDEVGALDYSLQDMPERNR